MRDNLGSRLAVLLEKLEETANRVVEEIDHSERQQSQQVVIESERKNNDLLKGKNNAP